MKYEVKLLVEVSKESNCSPIADWDWDDVINPGGPDSLGYTPTELISCEALPIDPKLQAILVRAHRGLDDQDIKILREALTEK